MIQKHCFECGTALIEKELEEEGIVPYCPKCQQYRFPMYNVAVSMIVVDEETGYMTLYGSGIVTNYLFKKGRLAFDFESINLTGEDWIEFNMWPNSGNTNFHLHFYANKESNFTCGGSGLNWTQKTFTWTSEQTNVVKKIEFLVVNKEEGSNALVLKLIIDGVEVAVLDNNITDPYATEPGAPVYFRMHTTNKASNFTVKSITWEPVE